MQTPDKSWRFVGLMLATAGVAAGFIVVIGTGHLLSGLPAPDVISSSY